MYISKRNLSETEGFPICESCSKLKGALNDEDFRNVIKNQCEELVSNNDKIKQLINYNLLIYNSIRKIKFYFETNEEKIRLDYKRECYEYFIDLLVELNKGTNDLIILRVGKILALAICLTSNENDKGLLDIFDNFGCTTMGIIETDCLDMNYKLNKYTFNPNTRELIIKDPNYEINLDFDTKKRIKNSLLYLFRKNSTIFTCSAYDLAEATQKWSCWKIGMEVAKACNNYSIRLKSKDIQNSTKYYC